MMQVVPRKAPQRREGRHGQVPPQKQKDWVEAVVLNAGRHM
jgi:hypothetical protein